MYTPFPEKMFSYSHLFIHPKMILLFVQQKSKHCEVAFLTSSSVIKHVIFALGVDCATRNTVKAGY